jgi:RHH-type proline utilization regulon transcriptional repressor/proline dehydrogenase/delta 1-pyrroline-5-carboxylate dehydrogenase
MLIAETGGLNAMIVDSTALPEQAVRDVLASAFQSAGSAARRCACSTSRTDVADEDGRDADGRDGRLAIGDPWQLSTDVGPVIDDDARRARSARLLRCDGSEGRS